MSKRRPDPATQSLRRFIAAGDLDSARQVLVEQLRKNPRNARARAELERLDSGEPLRIIEKERKRQAAQDEQNLARLLQLLADFTANPQLPAKCDDKQLRRMKKDLRRREKYAGHLLDSADHRTCVQLRRALSREQARRRKPTRRLVLLVAGIAGAAALVVLACVLMARHAENAAVRLGECIRSGDSAELESCLKACDTSMNRRFCNRLDLLITAAQTRLRKEQAIKDELAALFHDIRYGQASITELGPIRRMEIEHKLTTLPKKDAAPLADTWNKFCSEEQAQLSAQRMQFVERLSRPLPPIPTPGMDLPADAAALEEARTELMERCLIFADAHYSRQLDEEIIRPAQDALKSVNIILQENRFLQDKLSRLAAAQDYESYRKCLLSIKPKLYTCMLPALEAAQSLPDHGTVLWEVRTRGKDIDRTQLQAARKTLILGEPSITEATPASRNETHLADELLENKALRTPLYAVIDEARQVFFTEQEPVVKDGKVHFNRSALDPGKPTGGESAIVWENPHWVKTRRMDPTPLAGLLHTENRAAFFANLHYGKALDAVLRCRAAECPALARAFVYNQLVKMMLAREDRMTTGLPYSPSLQADIRSFNALAEHSGVELTGNCWLLTTPAHNRAEAAFSEWFSERATAASYAGEMAKNFSNMLGNVRPRFCGFIMPDGKPHFCRKPAQGEPLWHVTQNGISTAAGADELENAIPFSPIFTAEQKD
ncbi:MAG: hypothetical protein Q4C88_07570 [Akkermansia sp.]|nr:hypothetical protein [Akkermansia sp.]